MAGYGWVVVNAQENAASMLRTQAKCLGVFGATTLYILDGKAWAVLLGTVFRADDDEATQETLRYVRERTGHQV